MPYLPNYFLFRLYAQEGDEGKWITLADGRHILIGGKPSLTDTSGNKFEVDVLSQKKGGNLHYTLRRGDTTVGRLILTDEVEDKSGNKAVGLVYLEGGQATQSNLKGAGTLLVAKAIDESFRRGYDGRVTLASMPAAEGFYVGLGFTKSSMSYLSTGQPYNFTIGGDDARKVLQMAKVRYGGIPVDSTFKEEAWKMDYVKVTDEDIRKFNGAIEMEDGIKQFVKPTK